MASRFEENLDDCRQQALNNNCLTASFVYGVQDDGILLGEMLAHQRPSGFCPVQPQQKYSLQGLTQQVARAQTQWKQQQAQRRPPAPSAAPASTSFPPAPRPSSTTPNNYNASTFHRPQIPVSASTATSLSPVQSAHGRHGVGNQPPHHQPDRQQPHQQQQQRQVDVLNDDEDDLFASLDVDGLVSAQATANHQPWGDPLVNAPSSSSFPNNTSFDYTSNISSAAPSYHNSSALSYHDNSAPDAHPFGGANPFGSSSNAPSDDDAPICPGHGMPCLQRTANTAANPGRPFYKCAHQTEPCDFFQWVDGQEGSWKAHDDTINSASSDVIKNLDHENRRKFGHASFRPGQREIVEHAVRGRDVFVLMPTGGGKSLCYQLPAWCCPGVTVVISPLLSLIQDQVHTLNKLGVEAVFLASSQDYHTEQVDIVRRLRHARAHGGVKMIYITPEKLNNSGQIRNILQSLHRRQLLSRFVVDEAHCLSDWGHDFRPDYMRLNMLRQEYPGVPLMALTATANEKVVNDAIRNLGMRDEYRYKTSFNRPNLHYEVRKKGSKTMQEIADYVSERPGQTGVIYCLSRKDCEATAQELQKLVREKPVCRHFRASFYHADLDAAERERRHLDWSNGRISVLCATIAFGMGIDAPNVRFVLHKSMPKSLTHYYQESGRAGRDGEQADCILFYQYKDKKILENLIIQNANNPNSESTRRQVKQLYSCVQYCEDFSRCRRTMQLEFFGERFDRAKCKGTCDNCRAGREADRKDFTELAKSMLKLFTEISQQRSIGVTLTQLIDLYRGSKSKSTTNHLNLKLLSQYGAGRSFSKPDLERISHAMIFEGVLIERSEQNKSGFFTDYVHYGEKAHQVLNGRERFYVEFPKTSSAASLGKENKQQKTKSSKSPKSSKHQLTSSISSGGTNLAGRKRGTPISIDSDDDPAVASTTSSRASAPGSDSILSKDKTKELADYIKRQVTIWADKEREAGNNLFYWNILPNASMKSVAAMVPLSLDELKNVPGLGESIIDEYGDGIVDVCKAFVKENQAEGHVAAAKRAKRPKTSNGPGKKVKCSPDIIAMLEDSDDDEFGGDIDLTQVPDAAGKSRFF